MWNECTRAGAVRRNGLRTSAGGAAAPPAGPKDKAGYFASSDIQNIWRDLEARQVLNKRVLEGGTHSINVRIVTPKDAPLAHAASLDIWPVQAGSATAVTGGESRSRGSNFVRRAIRSTTSEYGRLREADGVGRRIVPA